MSIRRESAVAALELVYAEETRQEVVRDIDVVDSSSAKSNDRDLGGVLVGEWDCVGVMMSLFDDHLGW